MSELTRQERPSFWSQAEKAQARVDAWPDWKREAARAALVSKPREGSGEDQPMSNQTPGELACHIEADGELLQIEVEGELHEVGNIHAYVVGVVIECSPDAARTLDGLFKTVRVTVPGGGQ